MASAVCVRPLYICPALDWSSIPRGVNTAMTSVSCLNADGTSYLSAHEYKQRDKQNMRSIDFISYYDFIALPECRIASASRKSPSRTAMLHGVFLSMAEKNSATVGYTPVVSV